MADEAVNPPKPEIRNRRRTARMDVPENTFDLIHIRIMIGSIDNSSLLYKRAFNAIKLGGYFEQSETDVVRVLGISCPSHKLLTPHSHFRLDALSC
jgi:hypothetical protein